MVYRSGVGLPRLSWKKGRQVDVVVVVVGVGAAAAAISSYYHHHYFYLTAIFPHEPGSANSLSGSPPPVPGKNR